MDSSFKFNKINLGCLKTRPRGLLFKQFCHLQLLMHEKACLIPILSKFKLCQISFSSLVFSSANVLRFKLNELSHSYQWDQFHFKGCWVVTGFFSFLFEF